MTDAPLDIFVRFFAPCFPGGELTRTFLAVGVFLPTLFVLFFTCYGLFIRPNPILTNITVNLWITYASNQLFLCDTGRFLPNASTMAALFACALFLLYFDGGAKNAPKGRMLIGFLCVVWNFVAEMTVFTAARVSVSWGTGFVTATLCVLFSLLFLTPYFGKLAEQKWYRRLTESQIHMPEQPIVTVDICLSVVERRRARQRMDSWGLVDEFGMQQQQQQQWRPTLRRR